MIIKLKKNTNKTSSRFDNVKIFIKTISLIETLKHWRFSLEPYSNKQKTVCPSCGQKTFVHYLDTRTGARAMEGLYGRCDREIECGYHLRPSFESSNIIHIPRRIHVYQPEPPPPKPDTFPFEYITKSRAHIGDGNAFVDWLREIFHDDLTNYLIDRYHIGTTKKSETIFWQVDMKGEVRTGKTILYGANGKRRKDVTPPVNWIHSKMIATGALNAFRLKQCLFGLHLLTSNNKDVPVYVFEAEKTAIVASVFYRDVLCVATGALQNVNRDLLLPLQGRAVTFCPDKGAAEIWRKKIYEVGGIGYQSVDMIDLAQYPDLPTGFDIVDTLSVCEVGRWALNHPGGYPIFWDYLFDVGDTDG